ncbi:serine/threonine-protein kinase-like protein CCR4 [Oryza brachyantha]|uniref:serine/threonine-protein kinase-like protein CCR4 n=1 Tax=Oryza brachyantha TaxID=4533 RepID=UPI001ADB6555|nr:serine/threonine-protein kinase-like protein CCR4 [Oryza brachyantha]
MPMSRHVLTSTAAVFSFFAVVFFLPALSAARQFSTVAISNSPNATLVCALVRPKGSPNDVPGAKLFCTSMPTGEVMSYPSADVPYNAIAAGTDFLCGLMAPNGGHAAMRWWSFSQEAVANRSRPVGRRLYWGPSLRALSAGGPHVCGLSDAHDPTCWEWPALTLPKGLDFSRIALGRDFLCGVVKGNDSDMNCYGGGIATPTTLAGAAIKAVAAGHRHACTVDAEGGLSCWGEGYPDMRASDLPADMKAMALGRNTTCILDGDDMVRCWGVQVPNEYKRASFVSIEADGDTVCGVLTTNFSVVCWGNERFAKRHLIYNDTMPGACTTKGNCSNCGFIAGSGAFCGNGGGEGGEELVVCQPCKLPLNASRLAVGNGISKNAPAPGADDSAKRRKKAMEVAVGVVGVGVAVLAVAGVVFYLAVVRRRGGKTHAAIVQLGESSTLGLCRDVEAVVMPAPESSPLPPPARPLGCEEFTVKELSRLTNGFAEERKIGSGSFGSVYRAKLPDGREVAIKRAERAPSSRGRRRRRYDAERAFRAELRLLSRVNHRNLVQLLGFCEERGERILVFEFMPHGALHDHLHGHVDGHSPLFASWEARLRVALDAARGVEYLHCYAVPPIIHRDIKPSNILLDGEWTAKVSDFGLSLASTGPAAAAAACSTSSTAGTVGYIDPEYYRLQELTQRSDVYSFGVVLLELVTGRKAIHRTSQQDGGSGSPRNVIEFAVPAVETGNIARILDGRVPPPRGHETEAVSRVAKIAGECVRPRGRARPVMSEVVAELEWAVTLCEESLLRSGPQLHSSRHGGSDVSRSESDDPSPFHTREFAVGSGRLGHGRSNSAM